MQTGYVVKDGQKLRCGYTTGSCAAAAARAAAQLLHTGLIPERIEIDTPAGTPLSLTVQNAVLREDRASCCIIKDAGDDPDVTHGMAICAEVRRRGDGQIVIEGGKGIGRITRPGFWGPVGAAAINPVPRRMIRSEVQKVAAHGWDVLISAPAGESIAPKTFNARLGIVGGISIIGTTGLVEPMSDDALRKTIYLAIDRIRDDGADEILLFLGNYGQQKAHELMITIAGVKISNFIGDALSYCAQAGFRRVILLGHIGKLSKLALGAFNTHSRICDVRIEAFVYYLALAGAPTALLQRVNACKNSEEALKLMFDNDYHQIIAAMRQGCVQRIKRYLRDQDIRIEVLFYSMEYGLLEPCMSTL